MKKILMLLICLCALTTAQAQKKPKLETVATFGKSMPIGVSVTTDNRIFVAFPNYDGAGKYTLTELKNGKPTAYPNKSYNTKGDYKNHFVRVQDLYVDNHNHIWALDTKPASKSSIFGEDGKQADGLFKLIEIDTKTNKVVRSYFFEDLDKSVTALNDVRVDTNHKLAYLSDPGQAAIVVLDLTTGKSRVVLKESSFTLADEITITYKGTPMVNADGKPFSSNVNGIALTHDMKYFYFKPINKENLFRVETKYLADASLTKTELASKVEDMGAVGITHGLMADKKGNIYLTTSTSYTITYMSPDGKLHTLIKDKNLLWPDSLGIGTDGYVYFSCSQLQRLPQWNNGKDRTEYPYKVYKVKLP